MLEQTGNAITFIAQFLVSGAAGTGLTVTCTVYKVSDGSTVVSAQPATEIGGGLYKYVLASGSVPAEDLLAAVFNEAAATADQTDVPSLWVIGKGGLEFLDASIATVDSVADTIATAVGGATVTVSVPVDSTGTINLVRGDDYKNADGRVLSFSSADWPDLTAASAIVMTFRKRVNGKGTSKLGSSLAHRAAGLVAGGGTQTVEFEPLTALTSVFPTGDAAVAYDIQATLASGSIVTLQTGVVNVTEDQTY